MSTLIRRTHIPLLALVFVFTTVYYFYNRHNTLFDPSSYTTQPPDPKDQRVHWQPQPDKYPVKEYIKLPTGKAEQIPNVQSKPPTETEEQKNIRIKRMAERRCS